MPFGRIQSNCDIISKNNLVEGIRGQDRGKRTLSSLLYVQGGTMQRYNFRIADLLEPFSSLVSMF